MNQKSAAFAALFLVKVTETSGLHPNGVLPTLGCFVGLAENRYFEEMVIGILPLSGISIG
jgi:hypothetical protein